MTWEELYLKYSDGVYHYLLLMVGNVEVAEDLTHDTFLRVKQSLKGFRGDASYYTWVISIARNVLYDYWRRKQKIRFLPITESPSLHDMDTPEEIYQRGESVKELYDGIKKLKVSYQEVLVLRMIQELSVKETAEVLNCSESKVKSTTFRAMKALKGVLETERVMNSEEKFS
ncbi:MULTISPECIES: RNA polymerase sigma factor [Bacillaceae]|uniref:RNA polymerase sigma factor n=1 Tax=Evansella alkalicola TaxID=745819 RepID=A0ABS6JRC1_9BACI|nr:MULTISPECIES: RNA polymerase sigma factor [Bacillaceae]MBU9720970.1 RNA polymerase sigma factor [Bacillus alkalicola]